MKSSEEMNVTNSVTSSPDQNRTMPDKFQDTLITQLKEADTRDRKSLTFTLIISGLFTIIYASTIATKSGIMLTGYQFLSGGFLLIFLYVFIRFQRYKRIDYAAPVIVFLQKAEKRFRYWPWWEILISVPLLIFIGTGGGLIVYGSFAKYFPGSYIPLVIYFMIFAGAVTVGFWASRKKWAKEKQHILYDIRQVLRELGE